MIDVEAIRLGDVVPYWFQDLVAVTTDGEESPPLPMVSATRIHRGMAVVAARCRLPLWDVDNFICLVPLSESGQRPLSEHPAHVQAAGIVAGLDPQLPVILLTGSNIVDGDILGG